MVSFFFTVYTQRLGHWQWQWAFTHKNSIQSSFLWTFNVCWVGFCGNWPETGRETWFWGSLSASAFGMSLCHSLVTCFTLFLSLFLPLFLSLFILAFLFCYLAFSISLYFALALVLSLGCGTRPQRQSHIALFFVLLSFQGLSHLDFLSLLYRGPSPAVTFCSRL